MGGATGESTGARGHVAKEKEESRRRCAGGRRRQISGPWMGGGVAEHYRRVVVGSRMESLHV